MRYISYSLWGDNELYNIGMVKNAEQVPEIYPDWQMIVYYDNSVPTETLNILENLNVKLVNVDGHTHGMFWRFFASDLVDCEYAIFRDGDSRLSTREKMAVDEWIESGKTIHVMRDHPAHQIPYGNNGLGILGGMWGIKGNTIPMKDSIENFSKNKTMGYGIDQTFLKTIYNVFENDRCTHDDFFEKKPFPIKRENGRFIGERMNVNDEPLNNDYLAI
mgnify:FL=1|jgi:hypothetical protein